LARSAFFAQAYRSARVSKANWLADVRDAAWAAGRAERYSAIGFSWPSDLIAQLHEDWEYLDSQTAQLWGPGFHVTKAHVALSAIEYGLKSMDEWLSQVPNDRRRGRNH
jgi:hypothetical protein